MAERTVGEPTLRVHILLFESDWAWLRRAYPDGIKRSAVLRQLLRAYRSKIDSELAQRRQTVTLRETDEHDGPTAA